MFSRLSIYFLKKPQAAEIVREITQSPATTPEHGLIKTQT